MITSREESGVLICSIEGRLDAVAADPAASQLLALVEGSGRNVLLNLSGLNYVSSLGLRVFVRAAKAVKASEGVLKLCSATPPVQKVLEISALDTLLDHHAEEAAAIASF
tara:strand:- start:1796 stop:2125 length:330 start_codon:yes stop_codon:yes gene_type:complete